MNGKTVYGEEQGGNRGPGAKVERKQVDNDRFQSNQHNQQNIPQDPPTILPSTHFLICPPLDEKPNSHYHILTCAAA